VTTLSEFASAGDVDNSGIKKYRLGNTKLNSVPANEYLSRAISGGRQTESGRA